MTPSTIPSREIMWNVGSTANTVVMYLFFAISLLIIGAAIFSRIELWRSGKPAKEYEGSLLKRSWDFLIWVIFQRGVSRERTPGIFHFLIYFGFLVLTFTTTMVMLDHDFNIKIYHGNFYLWVTVFSDVFGLGLLIGILLAAHRRYIIKADRLHSRSADWLALGVLALLVVQGFVLEGLRIHVTNDPWAAYSPVGLAVAKLFWALSPTASKLLHFVTWWFHTLTFFAALAVLPYTKLFHIVSSSSNLFFRATPRPKGQLQPIGDIEKLMESSDDLSFGFRNIKDYTWKGLLDLDACTSCGRCQDVCPAYISEKPLSPKWLILDTRNHALGLHADGKIVGSSKLPTLLKQLDSKLIKSFLNVSGVKEDKNYDEGGSFRAVTEPVQHSAHDIGKEADAPIAGGVIDQDVFWSCNTCMACVEACPVGINHVDQIIGNRRYMALMEGAIPQEAQPTLRALENRGNPYGPAEDRVKWADGLDVPILKPGDSVEYLYWVGCVSAYDKRKQKIARALVTLMKEAKVSFGVLGNAEKCTGDPARRLGEENLFQSLAKQNIELLKSVKFKTLVANCPHCFNTVKNEYPEFGDLGNGEQIQIIHHSQLLKKLTAEGKLKLREEGEGQSVTFHDPCYLGRYNDEYDAPRDTLKKSSLKIVEMEKSQNKGMCCGAGGGHFWMDLKLGKRVNAIRVDQAAETGTNAIATACPFCMQMLEDGVKITEREMEVKDIAEFMVERLERTEIN